MKSNRKMNKHALAIIGAGHRGLPLVRHVLANPERAQLVALVDPNESNMAIFEESLELPNQPKRFADYKALLNANIPLDGVIIATPPNSHAELACAFLEAGIRVFLEKPMAHSLTDAVTIIKTAEKSRYEGAGRFQYASRTFLYQS
jgi:predicted dehydrogenase